MIHASGFLGFSLAWLPDECTPWLRDLNHRCDANLLYDATLRAFNRDAKQYLHTRDHDAKVAERLRNRLQSDTIPVRIRTLAYF